MNMLFPVVYTDDALVHADISLLSSEEGIDVFRVNISHPANTVPSPVSVKWEQEILNTFYTWFPTCRKDLSVTQWFGPRENNSGFNFGAPILTSIGAGGMNIVTFAVSDPHTPISLFFGIKNSKRGENLAQYEVKFFDRDCVVPEKYTADIRVDRRAVSFQEAVKSVSSWWEDYGYTIPVCPPAAEDPLYSTWYNSCQNPVGADLLEDLKIAADLGFKTVILDDGWQFEGMGEGCGYSKCGDWIPAKDKFPDFKAFVDGVHALGMKLVVWFGVPQIGYFTEAYKRFAGKFLSDETHLKNVIADIRYPELRRYLVDALKRFVRDYDIDGFKFDFIGSIQPGDITAPYDPSVMDCPNVEDSVKLLLEEATAELGAMKTDLLYEFRQGYIGPAISRFGNMLRVADCAYDSLTNRVGMVNLRLLNYPIAIHSDMLCWSPVEEAKNCAKQLLNIMFCVPQISVFLSDVTEAQRQLLRHYLGYWTENRDVLLHGRFCALYPESNYTYISAEGKNKIIAVLYADMPYTYTGKACDVHLNGNRDGLMLENPTDTALVGEIYDLFGKLIGKAEIGANTTVRLPVPEAGMLRIK